MSVLWWIFMSYFLKLSKSGMQQCHLQFLLCCWMVAVFCAKLTCAFNWTFVCIWRMCANWHCDCTIQLWFFWLLIFALLLLIAVWFVYPFAPFPFQSLTFRFSCLLLFCFLFSVLFCVTSLSVSSLSFLLKELAGCGHFTDGVPLLVVHIELFVCLSCIGLYVKNMDLYQRCTVIRTYLQCTLTHTLFYHVLLFSLSSI